MYVDVTENIPVSSRTCADAQCAQENSSVGGIGAGSGYTGERVDKFSFRQSPEIFGV